MKRANGSEQCGASVVTHGREVVCDRRAGHKGERVAGVGLDVFRCWTDAELATTYPEDTP